MEDLQTNFIFNTRIKFKIFVYRPRQTLKASRISRQLAHDGGKIVSLIYRLPLPHKQINLVLIYVRD